MPKNLKDDLEFLLSEDSTALDFRRPLVMEPVLHTFEHYVQHFNLHSQARIAGIVRARVLENAMDYAIRLPIDPFFMINPTSMKWMAKSIHGLEVGLTAYEIYHHSEGAPASVLERVTLALATAGSASYAGYVIGQTFLNNLARLENPLLRAGQFFVKSSVIASKVLPICEMPLNYYQARRISPPWIASVSSLVGTAAGMLIGRAGGLMVVAGLAPEPCSPLLITTGMVMIYKSPEYSKTVTHVTARALNKTVKLYDAHKNRLDRYYEKTINNFPVELFRTALQEKINKISHAGANNRPTSRPFIRFKKMQPPAFDQGLRAGLERLCDQPKRLLNMPNNALSHPEKEDRPNDSDKRKIFSAEFKKHIAAAKDAKILEEKRVAFQKMHAEYQNFSQTTHAAAHFATGLSYVSGSRDMQKIGMGVQSALAIGDTIMGVIGSTINPAAGLLNIAGSFLMLAGLFGNNDDEENGIGEALNQLYSLIHEMWKDLSQKLDRMDRKIDYLINRINEEFVHLNKKFDNYHHVVVHRLSRLNGSVSDTKDVILKAIQDAHLERSKELITEMIQCDPRKQPGKPQELSNAMIHWIEGEGACCRGLHVGAHEYEALDFKDEKDKKNETNKKGEKDANEICKVVDILKNPEDVAAHIGFLSLYLQRLLPELSEQKLPMKSLFNPTVWSRLTDAYIVHRHKFSQHIQDENNKNLEKVIMGAKHFLSGIQFVQQTPEIYERLLQGYENALIEIQHIEMIAIERENKGINDAAFAAQPKEEKIDIDLAQNVETNVNRYRNKLPGHIAFHVTMDKQDNGLFSSSTIHSKSLEEKMSPEFIFLHRQDQASMTIKGVIDLKDGMHYEHVAYGIWVLKKNYFGKGHTVASSTLSLKLGEKENSLPIYIIKYNNCNEIFNGDLDPINKLWNAKTGPATIDFDAKHAECLEKSKTKAKVFIKSKRDLLNLSDRNKNAALQQVYEKLDAHHKLLTAYTHLAGFGQEEIKKLHMSEQVEACLKQSLDDSNQSIYMAHQALLPIVDAVRANIIKTVKEAKSGSFFSVYQCEVDLRLKALEKLKSLCEFQQKADLKNSDIDEERKKEELEQSKNLQSLLEPYRECKTLFEPPCEVWLDTLSDKLKKMIAFKECQENYQLILQLFNQLSDPEKYENVNLPILFKQLHQACIDVNNRLISLSFGKFSFELPIKREFSRNEIAFLSRIGLFKPGSGNDSKDPKKDVKIKLEIKFTKGDGNCAFHALGEWNDLIHQYESKDAAKHRMLLANAVRTSKPGSSISELVVKNIRSMLNDKRLDVVGVGEHFSGLKKQYDQFNASKEQKNNQTWLVLVKEFIIQHSEILNEYAAFIGRNAQHLLSDELAMLAYVLDYTIHYYSNGIGDNKPTVIYNEGVGKREFHVAFNGRDHYERIEISKVDNQPNKAFSICHSG